MYIIATYSCVSEMPKNSIPCRASIFQNLFLEAYPQPPSVIVIVFHTTQPVCLYVWCSYLFHIFKNGPEFVLPI